MIKYLPEQQGYVRLIDTIKSYDLNSAGIHFNSQIATSVFGSELIKIDSQIKVYGSYTINPDIYNHIMTEIFEDDEKYEHIHNSLNFKVDIRVLNKLPYIWDLARFCNIYNLNVISLGIFKHFKMGFWNPI